MLLLLVVVVVAGQNNSWVRKTGYRIHGLMTMGARARESIAVTRLEVAKRGASKKSKTFKTMTRAFGVVACGPKSC